MILIDSSVWIDHIRKAGLAVQRALDGDEVLLHPLVSGELALGRVRERDQFLVQLGRLPAASMAQPQELMETIGRFDLAGRGIGYVDAHLLASARLLAGLRLWTRDRRLAAAARHLSVGETLH